MPQKPDYYEVLEVGRTATVDEIKRAFMRISMKCHPDKVPPAEKEAAAVRFQLAREAHEVLTNPAKRAAYDRGGHAGLSSMSGPGSNSSTSSEKPGQSYRDAAGPLVTKPREGADDFFDRLAGKPRDPLSSSGTSTAASGETSEQRRARIAEERRRNREAQRGGRPPASDAEILADAAADAADRLRDAAGVFLPADTLQKFRNNLQDLLKEVDAALERSRRHGGSGPRP